MTGSNSNPEPGTRSTTVREACTAPGTADSASARLESNTGPFRRRRIALADVDAGPGAHAQLGHQREQQRRAPHGAARPVEGRHQRRRAAQHDAPLQARALRDRSRPAAAASARSVSTDASTRRR